MLSHKPLPDELTADWTRADARSRDPRETCIATLKAIDKRDTLEAAERLHERPLPTLLAWAPDDLMFPLTLRRAARRDDPGRAPRADPRQPRVRAARPASSDWPS